MLIHIKVYLIHITSGTTTCSNLDSSLNEAASVCIFEDQINIEVFFFFERYLADSPDICFVFLVGCARFQLLRVLRFQRPKTYGRLSMYIVIGRFEGK